MKARLAMASTYKSNVARNPARGLKAAVRAASLLAGMTCLATSAFANPQGGQVVGGQGNITAPNSNLTLINQASSKLIINWSSFNIGANQTVQFLQPSASAAALNRIY